MLHRSSVKKKCNSLFIFSTQVMETESDRLSAFFSRNSYISGNYAAESSFSELNAHIMSLPGASDANRLFYLALPPTVYHNVTKNIKHFCMSTKSVHGLLLLSFIEYTHWLHFCCIYLDVNTVNLCVGQRLEQGDCRKTIWTRSSKLRRAVHSPLLALHRRPDLPHRSLPWQGNGAEPNGAQVTVNESTHASQCFVVKKESMNVSRNIYLNI